MGRAEAGRQARERRGEARDDGLAARDTRQIVGSDPAILRAQALHFLRGVRAAVMDKVLPVSRLVWFERNRDLERVWTIRPIAGGDNDGKNVV